MLRFRISFPDDFPARPPVVAFLSDVFHPLVTPLTTYTYSTRDTGAETVSAADEQRLPPGGLSLRHGFPQWFRGATDSVPLGERHENSSVVESRGGSVPEKQDDHGHPHIVEVLQYIRVVFDSETVLGSIPLEAAANSGAWHAWRAYRWKVLDSRATSPPARQPGEMSETSSGRGTSPRQQPGGARRPGEWNWKGVWEDRVRKSIQMSISEPVLFGGDGSDLVGTMMHSKVVPTLTQVIDRLSQDGS